MAVLANKAAGPVLARLRRVVPNTLLRMARAPANSAGYCFGTARRCVPCITLRIATK